MKKKWQKVKKKVTKSENSEEKVTKSHKQV